jgi:hypothetical protein
MATSTEKIFFKTIKEDRGRYFVEYSPPNPDFRFAILDLVFPTLIEPAKVAEIMESEVTEWISRYPVAVMAFSSDRNGEIQSLTPERPCDHLIAFKDPLNGTVCLHWGLLENERIPDDALNVEWLKRVYFDIPWRSQAELQKEASKEAKLLRVGWIIVVGWIAVLPAAWAVVQWAGPQWLATLVMIYAVWQAVVKALKLAGRWKKSRREIEQQDRERRMRHYFYHCEKNPEAFARLKIENFDREARDDIQREAQALKVGSRDGTPEPQ